MVVTTSPEMAPVLMEMATLGIMIVLLGLAVREVVTCAMQIDQGTNQDELCS